MHPKQAFQEQIESQLKMWGSKIDECQLQVQDLKARAEAFEKQAKTTFQQTVKGLDEKIEDLQAKLEVGRVEYEKLKENGEDAWDSLKSGMGQAWEDLQNGIDQAWEDLRITFEQVTSKFK